MRYITFSSQNAAEKQRRRKLGQLARTHRRIDDNILSNSQTAKGQQLRDKYLDQTIRANRQDRIKELATNQRQKRLKNKLVKGPVPTPSLPRPNTFTPSRTTNINLKKPSRINLEKGPVPTPSLRRPNTFTPSRTTNINLVKGPVSSKPPVNPQIKTPGSSFIKKASQNKWVRRGALGLGGLGVLAGGTALTMGALNRRKRERRPR